MHRQHDQTGGTDDDGEIGGDVPMRGVHRKHLVRLCAEGTADDQHRQDREHHHEEQREGIPGDQFELGRQHPAGHRTGGTTIRGRRWG